MRWVMRESCVLCLMLASMLRTTSAEISVVRRNKAIHISNGIVALSLAQNGQTLLSFSYRGRNFVQKPAPLFEFLMVKEDGSTILLTSKEADESEASIKRWRDGATVVVTGRKHKSLKVNVTCRITVPREDALTRWRIQVDNRTDWAIRSMTYPIVFTPIVVGETVEDDFLIWPQSDEAERFPAPGRHFNVGQGFDLRNGVRYPGGACLQLMTFGDPGSSLYFATYDSEGNVKRFRFKKRRDHFRFCIDHLIPESSGNDFDAGYDTILGGFEGDWHVAGDLYREWAWKQPWCKVKWHERTDVPEWLKRFPPVVYAGGLREVNPKRSLDLLPQITKDFMNVFGRDIVMFFHGWEKNGAQLGYPRPNPFPPNGGEGYFKSNMERIRALGSRPFVFISGPHWILEERRCGYDDRVAFETHGRPFAALDEKGRPIGFAPRLTSLDMRKMCPATRFWKDCVVKKLLQCVRLGVPMVQIDGFPCCQAYPCYNPAHGHPLGYGKWFYRAFADILRTCRKEAVKIDPDFAMATEGTCELFIPLTDTYMSRMHFMPRWHHDAFKAMKVPLFTYVYHEYLPPYGAVGPYLTGWKKTSLYFTRGVALNLLWGRIPTVWIGSNKQPLESAKVNQRMLDFLKRAVKAASTYAYDYVVRGRMLHPPDIDVPTVSIEYWRWWLKPPSTNSFESPAVLAEAWRAPNGSTAILLVNITEQEQRLDVRLPKPGLAVHVFRNGSRQRRKLEAAVVHMKMKPLEIAMIEYTE